MRNILLTLFFVTFPSELFGSGIPFKIIAFHYNDKEYEYNLIESIIYKDCGLKLKVDYPELYKTPLVGDRIDLTLKYNDGAKKKISGIVGKKNSLKISQHITMTFGNIKAFELLNEFMKNQYMQYSPNYLLNIEEERYGFKSIELESGTVFRDDRRRRKLIK